MGQDVGRSTPAGRAGVDVAPGSQGQREATAGVGVRRGEAGGSDRGAQGVPGAPAE